MAANFADDICEYILSTKNIYLLIKISLKFIRKGTVNYIPDNGLAPAKRPGIIRTNDD